MSLTKVCQGIGVYKGILLDLQTLVVSWEYLSQKIEYVIINSKKIPITTKYFTEEIKGLL